MISDLEKKLVKKSWWSIKLRQSFLYGGSGVLILLMIAIGISLQILGRTNLELISSQFMSTEIVQNLATIKSNYNTVATREAAVQLSLVKTFEKSGIVPLDGPPDALAFDGTHVWVTLPSHYALQEIDPGNGTIIQTVQVDDYPAALLFADQRLWITNKYKGSIQTIDPVSGEVSPEIPVGRRPVALAYDGKRIWVANYEDKTVQFIDAATGKPGDVILHTPAPSTMRVLGNRLIVGTIGTVEIFDLNQLEWKTGKHMPEASVVAMLGDNSNLWMIQQPYNLAPMQLGNLDIESLELQWMNPPVSPNRITGKALSLDQKILWVIDTQNGNIMAFDTITSSFSNPWYVGNKPTNLLLAGNYLWISNTGENTLKRFNIPSGLLLFQPITAKKHSGMAPDNPQNSCNEGKETLNTQVMDNTGNIDLSAIHKGGNWTCAADKLWTVSADQLEGRDLGSGEIVVTIPVPDNYYHFHGVTYAQGKLWVSATAQNETAIQTGGVLSIDPLDIASGFMQEITVGSSSGGIVYDGDCLWVISTDEHILYELDPTHENVPITEKIRLDISTGPGIAYDGMRVWVAEDGGDRAQYVHLRVTPNER